MTETYQHQLDKLGANGNWSKPMLAKLLAVKETKLDAWIDGSKKPSKRNQKLIENFCLITQENTGLREEVKDLEFERDELEVDKSHLETELDTIKQQDPSEKILDTQHAANDLREALEQATIKNETSIIIPLQRFYDEVKLEMPIIHGGQSQ